MPSIQALRSFYSPGPEVVEQMDGFRHGTLTLNPPGSPSGFPRRRGKDSLEDHR
jgi:hypothetical protein